MLLLGCTDQANSSPSANGTSHVQNNTTGDCAKAGETAFSYSDPSRSKTCCTGLVEITTVDASCNDLNGYNGTVCSNCGNGYCEGLENKCNCPGDCSYSQQDNGTTVSPSEESDIIKKAFNDLAVKGKQVTFIAEYNKKCETKGCLDDNVGSKYYREYYTLGKNRVDYFGGDHYSSSYQVYHGYHADFYLPDKNVTCTPVYDRGTSTNYAGPGEHGAFECKSMEFTNPIFATDLLTEPLLLGPEGFLFKLNEISSQTILGETARCFNWSDLSGVFSTDYCFSTDGIILKVKNYGTFESETVVTKLVRSANPTDFETLEGKKY